MISSNTLKERERKWEGERAKSKMYLLALNTIPYNVEVISVRMNERNEGETVNTDDYDDNNAWRRVNNSWFLLMDVCCVQKPQMDDTHCLYLRVTTEIT